MPLTGHDKLTDTPRIPMNRFLEICWSSLNYHELEKFGVSSSDKGANNHRPRRIDFVLTIQLLEENHALFEAWIELPNMRKTVFSRQPLTCCVSSDETFLHIDCTYEKKRLIALSITEDGVIAYAQSDLLLEAGFKGGRFEPPTLRRFNSDREVAFA